MDVRRIAAIGLAAGGLGIIGYAVFSAPSDEEQILEVLERLESAVAVREGGENPLSRQARINGEFKEIFVDNVSISIRELPQRPSKRADLVRIAAQAGHYFQTVEVDFTDNELEVGKHGAAVESLVTLDGVRGGAQQRDERDVRVELSKEDGDWRITRLVVSPPSRE